MKLDISTSALIALAALEQVASMAVHPKREVYRIAINYDANMRIMGFWGKNGTDETRIYRARFNSTSGPSDGAMFLPWDLQGAMTSLGLDYATMGSANASSGACLIRPEPGKTIGNHTAFWLKGMELAGPTPVYQNQNNVDLYCQGGV